MKVCRKLIINYAQDCEIHASKLDRVAIQRLLRLLRKDKRDYLDSWCLLKAVASSGLVKASSEVNLLFQLLKSVGQVGLLEQLQLKRALRLVKDSSRLRVKPIRSRRLVTREEFRKALRVGASR